MAAGPVEEQRRSSSRGSRLVPELAPATARNSKRQPERERDLASDGTNNCNKFFWEKKSVTKSMDVS